MSEQRHILDAIGNTPLVELRRIVPKGGARIVATIIVDSGLRYLRKDVFRES